VFMQFCNSTGDSLLSCDIVVSCCYSYDTVLMSRQQRYAVKEPTANKPGDAPPPGGDKDKPQDDTTTATADDKPSD